MSSGIVCADEVGQKYEQMKIRKTASFMVMKIQNDQVEVVEEGTEKGDNGGVQPFMEWISEGDRLNECCYAVIDVAVSKADGRQLSKLVFLTWAPDSCKIREKMKYASTKQAVGSVLTGASATLNATDISELGAEGEEIIALAG